MQKITPCLWFDNQAEEAATFYTSVFKDSKIINISRYGEESMGEPGSVLTVSFVIEGTEFMALNGGPVFKFNEAVSFVVNRETQAEIDELWSTLVEGGEESQCGWLKDKYGVSWQVVPSGLQEVMGGKDAEGVKRVMESFFKMRKIDIDELKRVYEQG